jgi:tellurite resistance protein
MPDDALSKRGHALEDEYFRKKDQQLIEKMRLAGAAARVGRDLSAKSGIDDPEMLQELQALGFTPDTVILLPLVPVIQVSWADGSVAPAERKLIVELARSRGIDEGSAADRQLSEWLTRQPGPQVFANATRLIRGMLAAQSPDHPDLTADDLVRYAERIAAASGGIFGINRISAEERALLATIAAGLKGRQP